MNPTFSKTISTIFIFIATANTGVLDPQYEFKTGQSRDQERSNSLEMATVITSIASVLVAILTLAFMGYKHWKKSKQDPLLLPTTTVTNSHASGIPPKDDSDIFYIYFILIYIASTHSRNSRPTTSYAPRPGLDIERRSGDPGDIPK